MNNPHTRIDWRQAVRVWREFEPTPVPESRPDRKKITIVGTGPVGLALAIDLGMRGQEVVVLGRFDFIPAGSKAICFSKRSLDILDRLGVGEAVIQKGVDWNVGKVFWQDRKDPIYQFDTQPVKEQKMPGFINIQQYYLEEILLERIAQIPNIELRWGHESIGLDTNEHGATLSVAAADGEYDLETDWLIACDGNKSTIRELLALDFDGCVFEDNFLIADIKMKGSHPAERWFWFDPPFNPGKSALLHKQPDDIWRLDFQLGPDVDREACIQPENVGPMIKAMLGSDLEFEEEWYSVYTFQCRRMESFVHDRVLFAGDSAHLVSPFGARGCNGGLADIDNLGWKLDLVIRDQATSELLDSFNLEAIATAEENILNSTRSTDFITPKTRASEICRDAVLGLALKFPFARSLVNSGRLSTAVSYPQSVLNTPDVDAWDGGISPGSPAIDAPLDRSWLMSLLGCRFAVLTNGNVELQVPDLDVIDLSAFRDNQLALERYDLEGGGAYLIRPDQYVAARFKNPTNALLRAALERAMGRSK